MKKLSPEIPAHTCRTSTCVWLKQLILNSLIISLFVSATAIASFAQHEGPLYVSSVSTRTTGNGTSISIAADGSMSKAQTWQDREGFHVVVPEAVASSQINSVKGIKVRKIGSSVEILVQAKAGARVALQVVENRLNLSVDSKLETREGEAEQPTDNEQMREYRRSLDTPFNDPTPETAGPVYNPPPQQSATGDSPSAGYPADTTPATADPTDPIKPAVVRQAGEYSTPVPGNAPEVQEDEQNLLGSIFSGRGAIVVLALGIVAFLAVRFKRSQFLQKRRSGEPVEEVAAADVEEPVESENNEVTSMVPATQSLPANGSSRERKSAARIPVTTPSSLFGAYRIDQEVGKLVMGQAHRMDVMASRATEDRRAIETSLLKIVTAPEASDEERRRARGALEEYGFVARQCATLLLAPEAYDRTSAARSLGEIGSAAALPFLLEALYDFESIVRNQAVVSIGELKVPSAIGALLDMARKHPDVPSTLVSRALSACSVEGLDFFDSIPSQTPFLTAGAEETSGFDITHLEPASSVEELPASSEDHALAQALLSIESADIDERAQAIKSLAQYQIQNSVAALSLIAQGDPESGMRALAMASLAGINHESVFSAVLIGMADDSREVRAAAARALSRLSFERADAYVRVIETADEATLRNVAEACIKAGIVSQNIDRLASSDRRQAYEAFSLICLLARAGLTAPVLNAIKDHANLKVRLSAVHLLATTGEIEVLEQLRKLASDDGLPEEVKTAILEGMYKLEQSKPIVDEPLEEFVVQESGFENSAGQEMRTDFQCTSEPAREIEVDKVEM